MPLILPASYMGETKIHNRDNGTQIIGYPCEGAQCQYCKQEAVDPLTQGVPAPVVEAPTVDEPVAEPAEIDDAPAKVVITPKSKKNS